MNEEKKSIFKSLQIKLKNVFAVLNKDVTKLRKKDKSKNLADNQTEHSENPEASVESSPGDVFEVLEENSAEDIMDQVEPSIEQAVIPEPDEIESAKPEEDTQVDSEPVNENVVNSETDVDLNEEKVVDEHKQKSQQPSVDVELNKNSNLMKAKALAEEVSKDEVTEVIEDEVLLGSDIPDRNINSIIRPDSVLSYLDDIVLKQEREKSRQVVKKVYKKNKNSHIISPNKN